MRLTLLRDLTYGGLLDCESGGGVVLTSSLLMATPDSVGTREVVWASLDPGDVVLPVDQRTRQDVSLKAVLCLHWR